MIFHRAVDSTERTDSPPSSLSPDMTPSSPSTPTVSSPATAVPSPDRASSPGRRAFLTAGAAAGALAIAGPLVAADTPTDRNDDDPIVARLIRENDALVLAQLALQDLRPGVRGHGGVPDPYGIPSANATGAFLGVLACAFASPTSQHYRSPRLREAMLLASQALLDLQHEDGTIDLAITNFRSPPDTAFVTENVAPAYEILRSDPGSDAAPILERLERFLRHVGDALATGGVHTPNHRWVVCAALAVLHDLFPDSRYPARIEQWLAEGIDLDPDGQYTERSTTIYSAVVNRAFLTLAHRMNRPDLRDPVRRNLDMTLYYLHPDGEVVTEGSRRQDRQLRGTLVRYYAAYREMAVREGNGQFASAVAQIEAESPASVVRELPSFLTESILRRRLPAATPLPSNYRKHFKHSQLARIRRDALSATLLAGTTTFFSLRRGSAALEAVRLSSAFFGKGQFQSEAIEEIDGRLRLKQSLRGPYFQPLTPEKIAELRSYAGMESNGLLRQDHRASRTQSNIQSLESTVDLVEHPGRLELHFRIEGTDHVPLAIELAFRRGGVLEGVEPVKGVADAYLLRSGIGRFRLGDDVISFGPGSTEHTWTQLRGALGKWDGQSVYLTGFTPFRFTLTLS
jgi:hypothetical protein